MPARENLDGSSEVSPESRMRRYTTRLQEVSNKPRGWSYLDVEILRDGVPIGSYQRNYPDLYDTFTPFVQNGEMYALYSPQYTSTRVMRLSDCADIGGEDPSSYGFCPTGYYVPYDESRGLTGQWGFICGCAWGDDSTWKIQYLDLFEASQGILRREEKFGYLEIPRTLPLRDAIDLRDYKPDSEYSQIRFTNVRSFLMRHNRFYEGLNDEIEQ